MFIFLFAVFVTPLFVSAAIIGTNISAQPLTLERIANLPSAEQSPWREYLKRSEKQLHADQDFLVKEMRRNHVRESVPAPARGMTNRIPWNRTPEWYAGEDAQRIADNMVSYQTPAGGWSKNMDFTQHPRAPGEGFAPDNGSLFLTSSDNDLPHSAKWSYVGTFDNGATTTQLRFLAHVIKAAGPEKSARWRKAFLHGLDYIFASQYPNGGWPQVWPLQGGYHDAITYNDGAMFNIVSLLQDVATPDDEYAFVPAKIRARAAASVRRGVQCILATQIVVNGRRTVWCQQHDALTLLPTAARNYEMPCECSSESASVMMFLMRLPDPSPEVVEAVHAAAAWFRKTEIHDEKIEQAWRNRRRQATGEEHATLWARCYEIGTDRPIFGDRDKTIHDDVNDISAERRYRYGWYGGGPEWALSFYDSWSKAHPQPAAVTVSTQTGSP